MGIKPNFNVLSKNFKIYFNSFSMNLESVLHLILLEPTAGFVLVLVESGDLFFSILAACIKEDNQFPLPDSVSSTL